MSNPKSWICRRPEQRLGMEMGKEEESERRRRRRSQKSRQLPSYSNITPTDYRRTHIHILPKTDSWHLNQRTLVITNNVIYLKVNTSRVSFLLILESDRTMWRDLLILSNPLSSLSFFFLREQWRTHIYHFLSKPPIFRSSALDNRSKQQILAPNTFPAALIRAPGWKITTSWCALWDIKQPSSQSW